MVLDMPTAPAPRAANNSEAQAMSRSCERCGGPVAALPYAEDTGNLCAESCDGVRRSDCTGRIVLGNDGKLRPPAPARFRRRQPKAVQDMARDFDPDPLANVAKFEWTDLHQ